LVHQVTFDTGVAQGRLPDILTFAFSQVVGQVFVHAVFAAQLQDFCVILAFAVADQRQFVVVLLLAVLAHDSGVLECIGVEHLFGSLACVDLDLHEAVVDLDHLVAFLDAAVQPVHSQTQSVFLVEDLYHFRNIAIHAQLVQQSFDLPFVLVFVHQNLKHFGRCLRIHVEDELVDLALELLVVQQIGDHLFYLIEFVAEQDQWHGVCQFGFKQEVSDLRGVHHFI